MSTRPSRHLISTLPAPARYFPLQSGRYDVGDDAELRAALINTSDQADTLVSIESDAFEGVRAIGGGTSPVSSTSGLGSDVEVEIPRDETVFLGGDGPTVLLENLTEDLTTGQSIQLTMTFEQAGQLTTQAMVDSPEEEVARGEAFDYHQEEQEGESDSREASSGAGEGN